MREKQIIHGVANEWDEWSNSVPVSYNLIACSSPPLMLPDPLSYSNTICCKQMEVHRYLHPCYLKTITFNKPGRSVAIKSVLYKKLIQVI